MAGMLVALGFGGMVGFGTVCGVPPASGAVRRRSAHT
jgi:hypothetical protein